MWVGGFFFLRVDASSFGRPCFSDFIREGVNTLLPLTQVGGDVVGARLSTFWAVPSPLAAASIIIDVLMQAVTQFLFAALGLVMLVALAGDTTVTWIAATGLALAMPMLGGFLPGAAPERAPHSLLRPESF